MLSYDRHHVILILESIMLSLQDDCKHIGLDSAVPEPGMQICLRTSADFDSFVRRSGSALIASKSVPIEIHIQPRFRSNLPLAGSERLRKLRRGSRPQTDLHTRRPCS